MDNSITYQSTRGRDKGLSFDDALINGLALDGGLYMPNRWPKFTYQDLLEMKDLDYIRLTEKIATPFVGQNLKTKIGMISKKVYKKFNHKDIAPLIKLKNNFYVMELFHGPTLAFKDYAMQFLAELFDNVLSNKNKKIVILGATSGDTGSAALEAFKGKKNSDIFILFPHGRVSEVQRKQMTWINQSGSNALAIRTDFDGCQEIVKSLFNDLKFRNEVSLSAINSINWARLVPQIVYYFYAGLKLGAPEQKVSFSVPTGNFGNILAGWIAMKLGLPIEKLICASNKNDILTRFFHTGRMERKNVLPSLTPSMDIQVSSNFERLLFEILDRDTIKLNKLMDDFKNNNFYQLSKNIKESLEKTFLSYKISDEETLDTIKTIYNKNNYLIDPHTAIAVNAAKKAFVTNKIETSTPLIALGCAHPAKFPETIFKSVNRFPKNPMFLDKILMSSENFEILNNEKNIIKDYIYKEMRNKNVN